MENAQHFLHAQFVTGIIHEAFVQSFRNTDFITWKGVTFVTTQKCLMETQNPLATKH